MQGPVDGHSDGRAGLCRGLLSPIAPQDPPRLAPPLAGHHRHHRRAGLHGVTDLVLREPRAAQVEETLARLVRGAEVSDKGGTDGRSWTQTYWYLV